MDEIWDLIESVSEGFIRTFVLMSIQRKGLCKVESMCLLDNFCRRYFFCFYDLDFKEVEGAYPSGKFNNRLCWGLEMTSLLFSG